MVIHTTNTKPLFFFHRWLVVEVLITTDEFDAYIIVSFVNATLVLSIGETVEEVTDSGFLGLSRWDPAHPSR